MSVSAEYSWLPEDMKAFIARTEAAYPPDAVNFSIAEQRAFYDKLCADFSPPHPAGVRTKDLRIAGVLCRRYTPSAPRAGITALFFHGGGFMVGGLHSHDSICAELAEATQLVLIAVDYRLVPEHLHPAAYDDCVAVFDAVPGAKLLVGDSAGGNLAACVSANRPGKVSGQVLIYPGLGGDHGLPSYSRHANAPMLTTADVIYYGKMRFNGAPRAGDLTASPLQADEYCDLPPTAIFTAQADPLASDGVEYAARLAEAGVEVDLTEEPGMVHGYLRARHMATGARDSFARIARALGALADSVDQ